jgi:hypothetical protein
MGPSQEAALIGPTVRNYRLRFRYQRGTARLLVADGRLGPGAGSVTFSLPLDAAVEDRGWRTVEIVVVERCAWAVVDGAHPLLLRAGIREARNGELAFSLEGGEAALDDIVFEEMMGIEEGSGPEYPWETAGDAGRPGGDPGPGPGDDGWVDIFNGRNTDGFQKNPKVAVKGGELQVGNELICLADLGEGEFHVEFSVEINVKLHVGVGGEYIAARDVLKGRHALQVRTGGGGVEVLMDGQPWKTRPGGGERGTFKLKVDGGLLRISKLRHRGGLGPPPGGDPRGPMPGPGPGPK